MKMPKIFYIARMIAGNYRALTHFENHYLPYISFDEWEEVAEQRDRAIMAHKIMMDVAKAHSAEVKRLTALLVDEQEEHDRLAIVAEQQASIDAKAIDDLNVIIVNLRKQLTVEEQAVERLISTSIKSELSERVARAEIERLRELLAERRERREGEKVEADRKTHEFVKKIDELSKWISRLLGQLSAEKGRLSAVEDFYKNCLQGRDKRVVQLHNENDSLRNEVKELQNLENENDNLRNEIGNLRNQIQVLILTMEQWNKEKR